MSEPRALRLRAPAKINWTLEVLGKRDDGYHEVRTILQTIDLEEFLYLEPATELTLDLRGTESPMTPLEGNLVLRAAEMLRTRARCNEGASLTLQKEIPVAAGLGGGSSDAAAVLRGLEQLWDLSISDGELAEIAAELGSDVPFFLRGGTALASGRGEQVEPLPEMRPQHVIVVRPRRELRENKTARMFEAFRPEHYTDGSRGTQAIDRIRSDLPLRDENLFNVFERVLPEVDPEGADLLQRAASLGVGQPHLCGGGPAFFFLCDVDGAAFDAMALLDRLLGLNPRMARTLSAHAMNPLVVPKPDWDREGQEKKDRR